MRKSKVIRYKDFSGFSEASIFNGLVSTVEIGSVLVCLTKYLSALVSQRCSLIWLRRTKVILEQ